MTTLDTARPGMGARVRTSITNRLAREARDAAIAIVGGVIAWQIIRVLADHVAFSTWWPTACLLTLAVAGAVTARDGDTVVRHGVKAALTHPLPALVVAAIVCLPWLGGWTLEGLHAAGTALLSAIATGVSDGVRHAVTGASGAISLPSPSQVVGAVTSHLPVKP